MATTSPSFSEATTFKKITKGKRKKKEGKTDVETLTSKKNLKSSKTSKESNSSELTLVSSVPEPVWEIEYSDPVPDLYPELSTDSLKMQESDTEQDERAKVCETQSHCDSEDNVQCVPTSCDDNYHSQDSHNNPGTSQQSENDSQVSNSDCIQTTVKKSKRKRKLSRPKKVKKPRKDDDNVQDTSRENSELTEQCGQAQETEKQGTWAQCSIPSCEKWRFLQNDVDPQEIPERWVCSMNDNDHYNTCSVSQETFDSQQGNLDVMYTPYPSGAVVWAKMVGYPWWPAMMESDPDYGYYCETGEDDVTPVMYHVVFFDKQVSRAWVNAVCIRNFSCDDDPEDMGKITVRGKNYRRLLTTATLTARSAAQMPLQTRISEYGFAARYKGAIGKKAVEEERLANLQVKELGDSVTDSSSQEICSSGNSYSCSPEEVKPKTPPKSTPSKKKPTNTPAKSKAKTKESGPSSRKKETGKKKDNKAKPSTSKASATITSNNKESFLEKNEDDSASSEINEPIHEPGRNQKTNEDTTADTKEPEPSVPSVSNAKTDSEEAICKDEESAMKTLKTKADNSSASRSIETKVVKKRRTSGEAQGGKKRKMSKDVQGNSENSLVENSKQGEQEKDNINFVTSTETASSKPTQVAEKSKQTNKSVENVQVNSQDTSSVKEDGGNNAKLSTSSASQLVVPKEKQQRKKSAKSKGISQDNLAEEDATVGKPSNQTTKGKTSLTDSGDSGKGKGPARPKNQANKAGKQTNKKRESSKSRSSSGEGTSSSEVLDQNDESEHHPIPNAPGVALKRSPASTDVRVAFGKDSSAQKKSLPKLVKAVFKPPMAGKGDKSGKGSKMPKLLKPQFVSPALAKPENDHDVRKEESEEKMSKSVAQSNAAVEKNIAPKTLKRKAKSKDQCSAGGTSKKAKKNQEHNQANNILSKDLQAEIEEIDNDIASIQEQLQVSDTSLDRSLPEEEEMITPLIAQQQILSDSPEF